MHTLAYEGPFEEKIHIAVPRLIAYRGGRSTGDPDWMSVYMNYIYIYVGKKITYAYVCFVCFINMAA